MSDAPATAKGAVQVVEPSRLQQTVARRAAESKAVAPELQLVAEADAEAALALCERLAAQTREGEVAPSVEDVVVKAAATALREFPRANAAYRDGRFELYSRVNVGVAVAAADALVVPTIFDADAKPVARIAAEARAAAARARAGELTQPELSGGTFTVTSAGAPGIRRIVPVLNPPQAAGLGVGAVEPRAAEVDGRVEVRRRLDLTLVCDHRILYGDVAAGFLARIRALVEQPGELAS
jgi:pyruvate dehydrogenase E2 component (dihydrolipoamide acetyltransferase)